MTRHRRVCVLVPVLSIDRHTALYRPPAKTEGVKKTFASALDQAAIGVNMVVSTGAAFGIGYYFAGYYSTDVAIVSTCLVVDRRTNLWIVVGMVTVVAWISVQLTADLTLNTAHGHWNDRGHGCDGPRDGVVHSAGC